MTVSTVVSIQGKAIKWLAYPLVFGLCSLAQLVIASRSLPHWPWAVLIAAIGIATVALLERVQPYRQRWREDHDDTHVDMLHAGASLSLIFFSTEIVSLLQRFLPTATLWPASMPMWLQIVMVGFIIDFGLWFMHWLSHKNGLLWRLHALHHSAERLYWLNGERRHPLSAVALATPGIVIAVFVGAPAVAVGSWFAIVAVHLAFQHVNLDYTVEPLRKLLAVAENHRWHHKREYEDAQVNFGEFWMIWDVLFRTSHFPQQHLQENEVGIRDPMPKAYVAQICWPFRKKPA